MMLALPDSLGTRFSLQRALMFIHFRFRVMGTDVPVAEPPLKDHLPNFCVWRNRTALQLAGSKGS
jgi:hypothetical protein